MDEQKLADIEQSLADIKTKLEKQQPAKKSWLEKLQAVSGIISAIFLGVAGLLINRSYQSHQLELQRQSQQVGVIKDFIGYFGDSSTAKTKAAMFAFRAVGLDSLGASLAAAEKTPATESALRELARVTPESNSVYRQALNGNLKASKYQIYHQAAYRVPSYKEILWDYARKHPVQVFILVAVVVTGLIGFFKN